MLPHLFIFTGLSFAVIHPLLFWTTKSVTLKNTFYRFNLTLACVTGSLVLLGLYVTHGGGHLPWKENPLLLLWWVFLMLVSALSWNRQKVSEIWISLSTVLGIPALFQVQGVLWSSSPWLLGMSALAGLIFSASLYSGVLGHWYIEMKHLPVSHLNRVTNIFGFLLCARLLIDGVLIFTKNVLSDGDWIPLFRFTLTSEGFFLWVALLFGTVFPFVLIFFVRGTLKAGSHTSATGILYVIFISILIGDLTYKYYWAKYGLVL